MMSDQTQPWAERTVEMPPEQSGFRRGVAPVGPPRQRTEEFSATPHESTGTGWPDDQRQQRPPAGHQMRQLRCGGEWSALGLLFSFVCWGIWAISSRGNLTSPVAAFLLTLLVAAGLFALSRLLGRLILERHFGRIRRSARGAHLVAGVFLIGVGLAYLRQTEWVVSAWQWVTNL
jgi:hypothetical protein